ncbi:MAG: hypothetical protein H0X51_09795 [Parachlamydiaceae bacterium]|nr:hypothetical protein [Parachlamydiaceae bacterium]
MSLHHSLIPEKATRILNLVLITLILIALRLWHLSVIQHDKKLEDSRKPQRRVVVEPARRATIRDRFNTPMAINKIQYRVAILYSQFRQVPSVVWTKDVTGKKTKQYKRREYIVALSKLLADELQLDPERVEDLIFSKAALYFNRPFILKEDISESEFYRLKMLEKDWLGIQVQRLPKRTYPMEKVGADIIGYMGAINQREYETVIGEIKALEKYIRERDAGEDPFLPEGIENPMLARKRLKELQERAYALNDYVGKTGIEGKFDAELRGFQGKKSYYSDARGNFLRELPGSREPIPGQRFLLTISAELQGFAEKILIQNERLREAKISKPTTSQKSINKQPWMKGGAIVAMDPRNGEILALASYPRIDSNDFVSSGNPEINLKKQSNILRWLENEEYVAQIWDNKRPIERERYNDELEEFEEELLWMTLPHYLDIILPKDHIVRSKLNQIGTIKNAIELQQAAQELLTASGQDNMYWLLDTLKLSASKPREKVPYDVRQAIEENLEQQENVTAVHKQTLERALEGIFYDYDKVLLIDLCRVIVNGDNFPNALIENFGNHSLVDYREASASMATLEPVLRDIIKSIFHVNHFNVWRTQYGKDFIQQKRQEEKVARRYAKPSIDYFDEKENQLFKEFWEKYGWEFTVAFLMDRSIEENAEFAPYFELLADWHRELAQGAYASANWHHAYLSLQRIVKQCPAFCVVDYLHTLRGFQALNRPLLGKYRHLHKQEGKHLEKHLAAAFYPQYGYGYGRSYAYRQAAIQGSLFKLVTAYAALAQRYKQLEPTGVSLPNLNPLVIVDNAQLKDKVVGTHLDGTAIPQFYKGGRIPKSMIKSIGRIDLVRAIETSSNPYFCLLAGDVLDDPESLTEAAQEFSFGSRTGIDLPGEIVGSVPDDVLTNRTGLYCTAIGQHSLVVTPLQSAVMLCAIANGGKVLKPQIIHLTAGMQEINERESIVCAKQFPYQNELNLVGVDFPLFTALSARESRSWVKPTQTVVKHEMFMPNLVQKMLFQGMHSVVNKMHAGAGLSALSRFYRDYPEAISDYLELKDQFIGKTSTAEAVERIDLDLLNGANKYTHVWFGGMSLNPGEEAFVARDEFGNPELVVVVYLRFGQYGKEALPLAAQVIQKWRDIKNRQE